jgi:hypothetical protein
LKTHENVDIAKNATNGHIAVICLSDEAKGGVGANSDHFSPLTFHAGQLSIPH